MSHSVEQVKALIAQKAEQYGINKELALALANQESGFNQAARSPVGAIGVMQLMPDTARGLGVDPEILEQNIDGGMKYLRQQYDAFGGDIDKVLAAYNAGPGAVQKYNGIPPYTETQNYVKSIKSAMGGGSHILDGVFDRSKGLFGTSPPTVPTKEPPPQGNFWEGYKEAAIDSMKDSILGGTVRAIWSGLEHDDLYGTDKLKYTEQDVEYVTKALPGEKTAQQWIFMNAKNPTHLMQLVQMKQEDIARREQLENYSKWATIPGMLTGALVDPTNLIPLGGQYSFALKAAARLGKIGRAISTGTFSRYSTIMAERAVTFGGFNVAERRLSEHFAGYEQDYTSAAMIGAVVGPTLGAFGDIFRASRARRVQEFAAALERGEATAAAHVHDLPPPNMIARDTRNYAKNFHDQNFVDNVVPNNSSFKKQLQPFIDGERAFFVSRAEAQEVAKHYGQTLPDNVNAFWNPHEDYALFIKDGIKTSADFEGFFYHEVAVHRGIELFTKKQQNILRKAVESRMKNPDEHWLKAIKSVHDGDWKEVLAYWVQNSPKNDTFLKQFEQYTMSGIRRLGYNGKLADAEIRDILQRGLLKQLEDERGYRLMPDGSAWVGGFRYSQDNLAHPNNMSHVMETHPENITQKDIGTIYGKRWLPKSVSQWMESGWFFGTVHGILTNSKSHILRKVSDLLLHDARGREWKGDLGMPVEIMKAAIVKRLNEPWKEYMNIRHNIGWSDLTTKGIPTHAKAAEFDRQVIECYNATYTNNKAGLTEFNWSADVRKGAEIFKKMRDDILEIGKTSSEMFGTRFAKNLFEKDFIPADGEIWRILDHDKWLSFHHKFGTVEEMQKFLTDYAFRAAKRDIHEKQLLSLKVKEWDKKYANATGKTPPKPTAVTEKELDKYIQGKAVDWAKGVTDHNNSNVSLVTGKGSGDLPFMEERFAMDTTMQMKSPKGGEMFSYDSHLRCTDLGQIVPQMINRFSGEAALRNLFNSQKALEKTRADIISQLKHAVDHRQISQKQMNKELQVFDDAIAMIRGVQTSQSVTGKMDALGRTILNLSYAQNGGQFGLNQFGDMGGAIAYCGWDSLLHAFPKLFNSLLNPSNAAERAQFIKDARRFAHGENLIGNLWQNPSNLESRLFKEATTIDSTMKYLDKVNTGLNVASRIVSTLSGLPKLTQAMENNTRISTLLDAFEWAKTGKAGGMLRKPFSETKLKAAGIDREMASKIKQHLNQYSTRDKTGDVTKCDFEKWQKENPDTLWKLKFHIENQSLRAVTQNTIGNTNVLKNAGWFSRFFFQFKDFTLRTVNGQTLRALTSRETDDALAMLFSMGTNIAIFGGITYSRAWANFRDNDAKREKYLEERLSGKEWARAAFLRGALTGSFSSFANDVYEGATGSQSIRTTVDRTSNYGKDRDEMPSFEKFVDSMGQLPATKTITSLIEPFHDLYRAAHPGESVTKKDLKDLYRAMPLQNFIPMVFLANQLIDDTDLPERPRKK